jgi:hypothetical protein
MRRAAPGTPLAPQMARNRMRQWATGVRPAVECRHDRHGQRRRGQRRQHLVEYGGAADQACRRQHRACGLWLWVPLLIRPRTEGDTAKALAFAVALSGYAAGAPIARPGSIRIFGGEDKPSGSGTEDRSARQSRACATASTMCSASRAAKLPCGRFPSWLNNSSCYGNGGMARLGGLTPLQQMVGNGVSGGGT